MDRSHPDAQPVRFTHVAISFFTDVTGLQSDKKQKIFSDGSR